MAKYFLGSVGTAEAIKFVNGEPTIQFVAKTLTDSSVNISISKDDVRGGTNAPIQFSFYHDPQVEITLTDILWKREYLESQLGTSFSGDNAESYKSANVTATEQGSLTLDFAGEIHALKYACGDGSDNKYVWFTEEGQENWKMAKVNDGKIEDESIKANAKYCVRYLGADDSALIADINSEIIPDELYLIITAPLFAGDSCAASNGKVAGKIQYEFPRFRLNGGANMAMSMSSNTTMELSGTALANENGCDATGSKLGRIIESVDGRAWYEEVVELILDEESAKEGATPEIYGLYKNGAVTKVDNKNLTFTPALNDGKFGTGAYAISVEGKPSLSETVTI